jgi:Tol biopolymer transport system component
MAANNPAHEKVGVWVMNADGTSRQFVSPGSQGRWSSDGGQIAYSFRYKGVPNIWVYSILDAESKTLLTDKFSSISPPTWSDDGKQIAFIGMRDEETGYRLFTVDTEGDNKLTERVKDEVSFVPPCWAPREKIVFFTSGASGNLMQLFDPEKPGTVTPIPCSASNVAEPAWSPDGSQIVFRCDR